jgi:hypothetical protein
MPKRKGRQPKSSVFDPEKDAQLTAAANLIGHTGAAEFQIRYCDEEKPTIWIAAARWGDQWESAAAMAPLLAVFRLCDEVIDGGQCQHCHRPTGFHPDINPMPMDKMICWYQWDPELKTFRRGCA